MESARYATEWGPDMELDVRSPAQGSEPTADKSTSVAESAIGSAFDTLDSMLALVPNPMPSSGQLRQIRGRGGDHLAAAARRARRPALVWVGTMDLIVERCLSLYLRGESDD